MTLGDQLRADDEVVGAARRQVELGAQGLDPAGKVRRQDERADVGKENRRFLRQPLDARPAGGERVGLVTVRAQLRPRFDVAAMMADERRPEAVLDQPCGAVGTFEAVAAGAAQRQRRIAAPVEEQKRLLAAGSRLFDAGDRARRQPAAARRALALEIDGGDVGQRRLAEPRREHEPAIASGLGVQPRLERGRCGGEHDRRLFEPRAHDRHVARIVDDAVFLLVGAVVLLVDDDEAEVGERQEQSRARPDDDPRFAVRRRGPDALALALGQPRVPFGRPRAEPGREPVEELGGERNLGQQHQPLPPLPKRFGDRLEIDFGLAGSGHPFEQGGRERAFGDAPAQGRRPQRAGPG